MSSCRNDIQRVCVLSPWLFLWSLLWIYEKHGILFGSEATNNNENPLIGSILKIAVLELFPEFRDICENYPLLCSAAENRHKTVHSESQAKLLTNPILEW